MVGTWGGGYHIYIYIYVYKYREKTKVYGKGAYMKLLDSGPSEPKPTPFKP